MQKTTRLEEKINRFRRLEESFIELETLWELGLEEGAEELCGEVEQAIKRLGSQVADWELEVLLSGPYDGNNAILTLHAGAGGTEAQDWVEMLLRMYTRWAAGRGYAAEILDYLAGDEAGVKSATLLVKGDNAYGYLKGEHGVHRLVRISPFDASKRRHTSFASVEVMPEVADETEIEIKDEDLKIDTYRSGGAGGQHVNKTDSAVRITHLPSGIVVQCQNERSQHANRETAMKILMAKLLEQKMEQDQKSRAELRGVQREIAWGSQIRSYVFQPYTLVKDHRTQVEVGNVAGVIDGNLDPFLKGYLQYQAGSNN